MARKTAKTAKKAKPQKRAAKPKAKKAKAAKRPGPKQPRLSGVEFAKDLVLDRLSGQIAGARERGNEAKADEKNLVQSALRRMQTQGSTYYKAHGVEMSRVAGDEKLRVRLIDDDNAAGDDELPLGADGDGEGADDNARDQA